MPDFILVIDDTEISLEDWHGVNRAQNPMHYSSICGALLPPRIVANFQRMIPSVHIAPYACLAFKYGDTILNRVSYYPDPDIFSKTIKYMVVTKSDLKRDLVHWNHFYTAGRLQKPVISGPKFETTASRLCFFLRRGLRVYRVQFKIRSERIWQRIHYKQYVFYRSSVYVACFGSSVWLC